MSSNTDGGMAGLKLLDDVIYVLKDRWMQALGGKEPTFTKEWNIKEVGTGTNLYDTIIVTLDAENIEEFGMLKGDTTNWENFNYDWIHDVSVTIDVRTSKSEARVQQLVNQCVSIFKSRVVPIIDNTQYVHFKVEGLNSLNEKYRNLYRYLISVSVTIENPEA